MYAKLFQQIFDSSLAEDYQTRHMFMDLLVLAEPDGRVDMTHEAIARRTNIPVAQVKAQIRKLCKPDPSSRSKGEDGARLVRLDVNRAWGWQIVNFVNYHKMRNQQARREYMRTYMQKRRADSKPQKSLQPPSVNTRKPCKPLLAHVDVDVDANVNADKDVKKNERTILPDKLVFVANGQKILATVEKAGGNPRTPSTRAWDSKDLGSYYEFIMSNEALSTEGKKESLMAGLRILAETAANKKLSRPLPYWKKVMKSKYPEWTQERKPNAYKAVTRMAQRPQSSQGQDY